MKVNSPIGELPYWFDGIELRDRSIVVRGRISEFDSTLVIEPSDLAKAARALAVPAATLAGAGLALAALRRGRRR